MAQNLVGAVRRGYHRATARLTALALRPGAVQDSENFRLWERRGYHITPVHFYSPIPDIRELEAKEFQASDCHGVDFRIESQLRLMQEGFAGFSEEYCALSLKPSDSHSFYLDNDAFSGIDPCVYYSMIRHFRPKIIIEVGSGHSTILGAHASRLNGSTRYVCIDPWPRDFIARGVPDIELSRQRVEDLNLDIFAQLQQGDILFVDSSHVVRTGGDVCFVILEVLPRLAPGVLVHFHDIFLPFDYPKKWIVEEQRFWTEQYLLHAYLVENPRAEVLFASHFISMRNREEVRAAFPRAPWIGGASFWLRKC